MAFKRSAVRSRLSPPIYDPPYCKAGLFVYAATASKFGDGLHPLEDAAHQLVDDAVQDVGGITCLAVAVGLFAGFAIAYVMGYRDNGIYTFRGIPYGTHQRFKYATPVESYGTAEQPTNALTNGSVSPQSNTQTQYYNVFASAAFMTPSESDMFSTESQCLNLNVWTDTLDPAARKPVLVFIHGGGLQSGSALELMPVCEAAALLCRE